MPLDAKSAAPTETYKGGLKGYWKSRGYHRADGDVGPRRRPNQAELGGGARRRRPWKVKIKPKLRFLRSFSPRRFLARLRDAYVRMMLRIASSPGVAYAGYGFGSVGFGAPRAAVGFGQQARKEYDEKVIVEIYKSLVAQGALLAAVEAGGASAGGAAGGGVPGAPRRNGEDDNN